MAAGRPVEETIVFGPVGRFACLLRPDPAADAVRVTHADGRVIVTLPVDELAVWADTDAVGISAELDVCRGVSLRVLIEKDFECLDGAADENQADAFPNPSVTC